MSLTMAALTFWFWRSLWVHEDVRLPNVGFVLFPGLTFPLDFFRFSVFEVLKSAF